MSHIPIVSIIVPCRNERNYIEECISSILGQERPSSGNFEVLVVDGMSTDGTRDVLKSLAVRNASLRVMDNPRGITASAMNIGIDAARGRYVAILGAHTEYAPNYIRQCVELLEEHPEVCCAGGPIISRGKSLFGQAVAAAMSHPIGVGNAKHRFPDYEGYAEAVCFPVFRKTIFETAGLFDESLIRNQDDEFYYRLALAGEKTFLSPRARCTYFVRETPAMLFRQYFQYGFWRLAVVRKHRTPASIRQIVPATFVLLLLLSVLAWLFLPGRWHLAGALIPAGYGVGLFAAGIGVALKQESMVGFLFPVAAAILHLAYGAGFLWGLIRSRKMESEPMDGKRTVLAG